MTTSDVKIPPTTGANIPVATYDISEDAETKKLQRIVLNDSAGVTVTQTGSALDVNIKSGASSSVNVHDGSGTSITSTGSALDVNIKSGAALGSSVDLNDGAGNAITSTGNALDINVKSGGNANGRAVPGSSAPVVLASQTYQDVAASQTATVLGSTGATGDWLDGVLVIPETTAAGTVALLDNATSVNIFVTGTLSDLAPIYVKMGCVSKNGAWKITTGANVHIRAIGNFT
jgi:hypothetical protein